MKKIYLFISLVFSLVSFSQGPGGSCSTIASFCGDASVPFNNVTNTLNLGNIGCLGTSPNGAWYSFQVSTSGLLEFEISQTNAAGVGIDVDYICWGPFTTDPRVASNLCTTLLEDYPNGSNASANNIVDCSYSGDPVENFSITNAVAGQFYVLLITNYSNQSGTITFDQTNNTGGANGSTNCEICGVSLGPDRFICNSAVNSVTLTANFYSPPVTPIPLNYRWYLNGVLQTTTTTNSLVVNQNGVWRVEVDRVACAGTEEYDEIIVDIASGIATNIIGPFSGPTGECNPTFDLTSYLTDLMNPSNPSNYTYEFYDLSDGSLIPDPTNFTPLSTTQVIIKITLGICESYSDPIDIIVDCVPVTCSLTLTSSAATIGQSVCINQAISDIIYTAGGSATGVILLSGALPAGVTGSFASGIYTISGTPTETGTFNYTVETVGCSPNLTLTGVITINPNPTFTSLTANGPICVGANAVFTLAGSAGANVFYTINSNPIQFVTLDASGNGVITITGASADVVITLSEIELGTCDINLVNTATVFISPTPAVPAINTTGPTCSVDGFSTITNYDGTLNYTFNPAGPTIGVGGLISGMVLGTPYTVTAGNGTCTSLASSPFTNVATLSVPVLPVVSITAPTCLANGFATITNYVSGQIYTFNPAGPSVDATGLVSGMAFGTSYVVSAGNGSCSSADTALFSVNSILPTPVAPVVSETAPTCLADGFSTITNYDATLNYVFNPAGPTINASGLIQGMVLGTSYSVTSTNASLCTSLVSNNFVNNPMLVTPTVPVVSITAPTCLANGFATITNYVSGQIYTFNPAGPSVDATGLISGMTFGTSYVVSAGNGSCSSADTALFSVNSILPTPVAPVVSVTAPTCLADGFSTITNYDATLNYVFNPAGPTINASGLIQGMVLGISYSVTSTNASLCTSLVSNNFVNSPMLITPVVPTISVTAPTCLANGFTTITNYVSGQIYTFNPAGPSVDATGLVSGMTFGTSYVVSAGNGSCSSADTALFSVNSILPTPVAPVVSETAPTCLADGFSTITNYDATLNYVFNPAGPTINASGLIQGMVLGTSYSVTSTNASLCTSLVSNNFVNNPMLVTPTVPVVSITAPTCLANGFATITNYVSGQIYTFNPAGPSVDATGLVSGMTFGTSYVVLAGNGSCTSADTALFSVNSILPTPVAPVVSVTAPTCLADGFSTITNYDATLNYVFNPAGPTINASGLIQGMVLGTSYSVTSTNASLCTSLVSNNFVNNPMLVTPTVPVVSITAPTCLANGFATITNYVSGQIYTFNPVGPSVDATGLISGMTFGTSYVVSAGNGSCTSANTALFNVNSILPTPVAPVVSVTAPTCLADGFSTITNYDATLNYVFNPAGPTINASGLIQGMVLGTSYSVTSTNASLCTSAVSNNFVNSPMLITPVVPTISVTAPTCLANGFATITNYVSGQIYTFNPAGPSVDATGLISGMTFGTSYVVSAGNGSCTSANTALFNVNSILPTPVAPVVSVTAPTCLADGFSTITNYDATLNYVFNPAGPTINASGLIQGMVLGTSYSVTSTNASLCTSAVSNNFVNSPMLITPVVPTISVTAPTCLANGFATITNYVSGQIYTFNPAGPSVDATGLISGMTFGTSYVVSAGNGSCTSVNTTSFVITQQLPLPTIVSVTNNGPICLGSTAIFTINASPNTQVNYSINSNPNQTVTINSSGVRVVSFAGVTGNTTLNTVSVFDGVCTSNVVVSSTVNLFANTTIALVSPVNTENQSRCAGVTIDPIQYQVTGTATGVVVTGLPVGVTYNYNTASGLVTISGSANTGGVYNYSVTTTGGCNPQVSATGSITITGLPVLSYSVTNTICNGSTLDFVLNSSLPNTSYIWSATVSNISGSYSTTTNGDETNINQIATLTNPENIGTITMIIIPTANGCFGAASSPIVITVNPIPVIESVSVADNSVCSATNATNNVHVDIVGNISGITYTWTAITSGVNVIGGPTSGTITSTSTTASLDLRVITSNPLVAGTIYFEVTPMRNGCPGNLMTSGIVTVNPNPGLPISSPVKTICSGNSTDLRVDVSPLIVGTQLTWEVLTVVNASGANPGTGVAPVIINDVLTATTNTQGYVIYRVRSTLGDCQGGYTDYRVNVNPSPRPVLTDGNICITATGEVYQTYTLNTGLNDVDYDFVWFDSNGDIIPGATNSTLVVDAAGTYSVIATNWLTGCSSDPLLASATATVTETTPATVMTVVQSEYFSDNATITVNVTGGSGTLLYSIDEGSFQSSNVFTGVSAGEHLVTVIDSEGCTYMTQEVLIIDYPTYFTPNGDGINDTWNIAGLNQTDAKLYIFDRYGKLLKQLSATDSSQGWDGTHNQQLLPSTDYWFTLDYTENGVAKQFKAHFSLNR